MIISKYINNLQSIQEFTREKSLGDGIWTTRAAEPKQKAVSRVPRGETLIYHQSLQELMAPSHWWGRRGRVKNDDGAPPVLGPQQSVRQGEPHLLSMIPRARGGRAVTWKCVPIGCSLTPGHAWRSVRYPRALQFCNKRNLEYSPSSDLQSDASILEDNSLQYASKVSSLLQCRTHYAPKNWS